MYTKNHGTRCLIILSDKSVSIVTAHSKNTVYIANFADMSLAVFYVLKLVEREFCGEVFRNFNVSSISAGSITQILQLIAAQKYFGSVLAIKFLTENQHFIQTLWPCVFSCWWHFDCSKELNFSSFICNNIVHYYIVAITLKFAEGITQYSLKKANALQHNHLTVQHNTAGMSLCDKKSVRCTEEISLLSRQEDIPGLKVAPLHKNMRTLCSYPPVFYVTKQNRKCTNHRILQNSTIQRYSACCYFPYHQEKNIVPELHKVTFYCRECPSLEFNTHTAQLLWRCFKMQSLCLNMIGKKIFAPHIMQSAILPQHGGCITRKCRTNFEINAQNCFGGHLGRLYSPLSSHGKIIIASTLARNPQNNMSLSLSAPDIGKATKNALLELTILLQNVLYDYIFSRKKETEDRMESGNRNSPIIVNIFSVNYPIFLRQCHFNYYSKKKDHCSFPLYRHYTCVKQIAPIMKQDYWQEKSAYRGSAADYLGHYHVGTPQTDAKVQINPPKLAVTIASKKLNNTEIHVYKRTYCVNETSTAFYSPHSTQYKIPIAHLSAQTLKKKGGNANVTPNGLNSMFFKCRSTQYSSYRRLHAKYSSQLNTLFPVPRIIGREIFAKNSQTTWTAKTAVTNTTTYLLIEQ